MLEFFTCKCHEIFKTCISFLSQNIIKTSYTVNSIFQTEGKIICMITLLMSMIEFKILVYLIQYQKFFIFMYFKKLEWNQHITNMKFRFYNLAWSCILWTPGSVFLLHHICFSTVFSGRYYLSQRCLKKKINK